MKKLTPKQAFDRLKAIASGLKEIRPGSTPMDARSLHIECVNDDGTEWCTVLPLSNIDWRTHQKWPGEAGTWRAPVLPADAGRECRVRDWVIDEWRTAALTGYTSLNGNYCWVDDAETGWAFCEVFDPAPVKPARKARTGTRSSKATKARKSGK